MSGNSFEPGDVFGAPDPYSTGSTPRPRLVLAADNIPYAGEEYICAGLTLSDLPDNVEVRDGDCVTGNDPDTMSYCSPWVLAAVIGPCVTNFPSLQEDRYTVRHNKS